MDKVDRSVSRSQGCRRIDWPLLSAFFASFPPAFLVNFPIFLKSGKSWDFRLSNRFPITPPKIKLPEFLPHRLQFGSKQSNSLVYVFERIDLDRVILQGQKDPKLVLFRLFSSSFLFWLPSDLEAKQTKHPPTDPVKSP